MRCGYSAMFEPVGTVDHFVSVDEDMQLAYDWGNYRYASGWINSSKQMQRGSSIRSKCTTAPSRSCFRHCSSC